MNHELSTEQKKEKPVPQVLMEYPGAGKDNEQDVFLLLRPETNNYKIESSLLSVFRYSNEYNKTLWIRYLANLSGQFIEDSKMILHHYETRVFFARYGKNKFTPTMKKQFEQYFHKEIDDCEVFGAFSVLESKRLNMTSKEMFEESLKKEACVKIQGQEIKQFLDKDNKKVFVVNADIPHLLTRDYKQEDCAVVMFRTTLDYPMFNEFIKKIYFKLVEEKLLPSQKNEKYDEGSKRAFHYSKGPFEQVRDAYEYLYSEEGERIAMGDLTFVQYLLSKGISLEMLERILRNPLGRFTKKKQGDIIKEYKNTEEDSLFERTLGKTYKEAHEILLTITQQRITYEKKRRF